MSLFHNLFDFGKDLRIGGRQVFRFPGILAQVIEFDLTRAIVPLFPSTQNTLPFPQAHRPVMILGLGVLKIEIVVLLLTSRPLESGKKGDAVRLFGDWLIGQICHSRRPYPRRHLCDHSYFPT